eukprot:g4307.t1
MRVKVDVVEKRDEGEARKNKAGARKHKKGKEISKRKTIHTYFSVGSDKTCTDLGTRAKDAVSNGTKNKTMDIESTKCWSLRSADNLGKKTGGRLQVLDMNRERKRPKGNEKHRASAFSKGAVQRLLESDVVWKSSPTKSLERLRRRGTRAERSSRKSTSRKPFHLHSEFQELSRIIAKVRHQHKRKRPVTALTSQDRTSKVRGCGTIDVENSEGCTIEERISESASARDKSRCQELLKIWLARTPSLKKSRSKRKRSEKKHKKRAGNQVPFGDDGAARTAKKRAHDRDLFPSKDLKKESEFGSLLRTLNKVEEKLRGPPKLSSDSSARLDDGGDDDDDDEGFLSDSSDLDADAIVESLKILEAFESQSDLDFVTSLVKSAAKSVRCADRESLDSGGSGDVDNECELGQIDDSFNSDEAESSVSVTPQALFQRRLLEAEGNVDDTKDVNIKEVDDDGHNDVSDQVAVRGGSDPSTSSVHLSIDDSPSKELNSEVTEELLEWLENFEAVPSKSSSGSLKIEGTEARSSEPSLSATDDGENGHNEVDDTFDLSDSDNSVLMTACVEMMKGVEEKDVPQRKYDHVTPPAGRKRELRDGAFSSLSPSSLRFPDDELSRGTLQLVVASCRDGFDANGHFKELTVGTSGFDGSPGDCNRVEGRIPRASVESRVVRLRNEWADLEICEGDKINVFSCLDSASSRHAATSDTVAQEIADDHLVVLHPDLLLSPSRIAQCFPCLRRGMLSEWLRSSQRSRSTVMGQLKHELFERCLRERDFTPGFVDSVIDSLLGDFKFVKDLFAVGETDEAKVRREMRVSGDSMRWWASRHMRPPLPHGGGSPPDVLRGADNAGLVLYTGPSRRRRRRGGSGDDTPVCPSENVLFEPVPLSQVEVRSLVNQRNLLATHLRRRTKHAHVDVRQFARQCVQSTDAAKEEKEGDEDDGDDRRSRQRVEYPSMLRDKFLCKKCYHVEACALYHAAVEEGDFESSGFDAETWSAHAGHLSDVDKTYFRTWERLLNMEAGDVNKVRSALWRLSATQRVREGSCVRPLCLVQNIGAKDPREYRFRPASQSGGVAIAPDAIREGAGTATKRSGDLKQRRELSSPSLTKGDLIVVTYESETGHSQYAVGAGTISCMRWDARDPDRSFVDVRLWHPLSGHLISARGSWRIDRDELGGGMRSAKENLIRLFSGSPVAETRDSDATIVGDFKRRRLIVRLEKPLFRSMNSGARPWREGACSDKISSQLDDTFDALNGDQQAAILRAFSACDYTLIRGMPGTGKTVTVAFLVRAFLSVGKSVLVTSYTHSAVDNLLLKLIDVKGSILRIGNPRSVHAELEDRTPARLLEKRDADLGRLSNLVEGMPVVGATCLGAVSSPLLQRRHFDVCIVDEAGQIAQPVCLGPLRMANVFVLLGDENQLAPLVRNP